MTKLVEIKASLKFFDDGNFTPALSQPRVNKFGKKFESNTSGTKLYS